MKTVLTLSAFNGSLVGHGGEKRTQQIRDVVSSRFSNEHIVFPIYYNSNYSVTLQNKLFHAYCVPEVRRASELCRQSRSLNKLLGESYKFLCQSKKIDQHSVLFAKATTIIWENNYQDFFYFPYLIKKKFGKKIIACPQNIESLVPRKMFGWLGRDKLDFLRQELEPFRLCDEVFAISEEDQWLFNLLDIKAKFLPNFPGNEQLDANLKVRQNRQLKNHENYFLILGSVGNPPTLNGMIRLLTDIQKVNSNNKFIFKVAGYGTEVLRDQFGSSTGMDIMGSLEQKDLDHLMENCKAMIINQDYCPGALTKVPEILASGISVIMNTGASRSYKRVDGVYVYDSVAELEKHINSSLPMPSIPSVPSEKYNSFIDAID